MAFEKFKLFRPRETKDFSTREFENFLNRKLPGRVYETIVNLKNGIRMGGITPHDTVRIDQVLDVVPKNIKVANPNIFRQQLESYLRTGEVSKAKGEGEDVLHLNEMM